MCPESGVNTTNAQRLMYDAWHPADVMVLGHLHYNDMQKRPSEQLADNVFLTFQDDITAFRQVGMVDPHNLMWANDFPHSDSTWPWSQELLKAHTAHLTDEEKALILCDNAAKLYGIDVASLPSRVTA